MINNASKLGRLALLLAEIRMLTVTEIPKLFLSWKCKTIRTFRLSSFQNISLIYFLRLTLSGQGNVCVCYVALKLEHSDWLFIAMWHFLPNQEASLFAKHRYSSLQIAPCILVSAKNCISYTFEVLLTFAGYYNLFLFDRHQTACARWLNPE